MFSKKKEEVFEAMKTFYVATRVEADSTRKQAAEALVARVIAHAEKMHWNVVRSTESPLDVSSRGSCSVGWEGPGKNGARKRLPTMKLGKIMEGYASAIGNGDMCLHTVSVTYDARDGVERASIWFRIEKV